MFSFLLFACFLILLVLFFKLKFDFEDKNYMDTKFCEEKDGYEYGKHKL